MAFRFDGSGSLRLSTSWTTNNIGVYGIAERHTALSVAQLFAALLTSATSSYVTAGGAAGDDAQVTGLRHADADTQISTVLNWSSAADFAPIANGTLFSFAIIPYLDSGTPRVKFAIRPYPTGTLYTTTRTTALADWTNTKIYIGAGSGNGNPCRCRISNIAVRNVSEPDDVDIEAYFDSHHLTGSDIATSISGIGKADLAAALLDESGNGVNWSSSGAGITLDDSNNPTSNPTISGVMVMPDEGSIGGPAPSSPAAPSSLTATVVNSDTVKLEYTDNASTEVEFVGQVRSFIEGVWTDWADEKSVAFDIEEMSIESLAPQTLHEFRVRAQNAAGSSSYSNTVQATTQRLYVRMLVNALAADETAITVALWRPGTTGRLHGAEIPVVHPPGGWQFNEATVDEGDGDRAVLEVDILQPPPAEGQAPQFLRNGDTVYAIAAQLGTNTWVNQIIPDAEVIEE
jgi:hypothetical protein